MCVCVCVCSAFGGEKYVYIVCIGLYENLYGLRIVGLCENVGGVCIVVTDVCRVCTVGYMKICVDCVELVI